MSHVIFWVSNFLGTYATYTANQKPGNVICGENQIHNIRTPTPTPLSSLISSEQVFQKILSKVGLSSCVFAFKINWNWKIVPYNHRMVSFCQSEIIDVVSTPNQKSRYAVCDAFRIVNTFHRLQMQVRFYSPLRGFTLRSAVVSLTI